VQLADRIDDYSLRLHWLNVGRFRAFASHLGVSATIVAIVFAVVFFAWYPRPYFAAVGTGSIVRVLIGVDLVLGPLLTLIVFRPGKRLLLLDVACIAIVQLSALVYGLSVLYQERPYYTVFALDRVHVLAARDVDEAALEDRAWIRKPAIGPLLVSARRPEGAQEQQKLLEETLFGGAPDIERRPSLWVPLSDDIASLRQRAHPIDDIRRAGKREAALVDRTLGNLDIDESRLGFLPMISAKNTATGIFDLDTGALVAALDIDGWQLVR
jgi:hypothetical protein